MKKMKFFLRSAAVFLTCSLLYTNQPWTEVVAEEVQNESLAKQYVSAVKMFYGDDEKQARSFCESEGYIFCPQNLKEGSKSYFGAYIGYKTTDDPGNAITDMTLLDMKNSHYEEMSYKDYLESTLSEYSDQAAQCMVLVNEFRTAFNQGSENALVAYDSLNLFYVDEKKSHTAKDNLLGNYMLGACDASFFERFIQRGNANVYCAIISILAGAASDCGQRDTSWVERAKKSAIPYMLEKGDSGTVASLHGWYQDAALQMIQQIRSFAETYTEAKSLYDTYGDTFGYAESEGLTDDSTAEDLLAANPDCKIPEYIDSMELYALMDSIVYQEQGEVIVSDASVLADTDSDDADESAGNADFSETVTKTQTLAEYFLSLAQDADLELHPERIYPLVEGMTPAQRIVMNRCGLKRVVELLFPADDYNAKREDFVKQTESELIENGIKDAKLSIMYGVDDSVYTKKTVVTSELKEAELSGKAVIDSENAAARAESSSIKHILDIVDIATMAVSGVAMITQALIGTSLWAAGKICLTYAVLYIGTSVATTAISIGAAIASVLLCSLFVLNIIAMVVSLCYMVYTILDMCGVFTKKPKIDYDAIPDIMFHIRSNASGDYRVRYDVVGGNIQQYARAYNDKMDEQQRMLQKLEDAKNSGRDRRNAPKVAKPDPIGWGEVRDKMKNIAEITGYQGYYDRWVVLYTTKSPAAGQPIEVVPGESIIRTQKNDYKAPEGFRGVALASGKTASDLNAVKIKDKTGTPLYMFFPGKSSAIGSATIEASGTYVTNVLLVHDSDRTNALNLLKKDSYQPIEQNLTPTDDYTFIGYKTGSAASALTDLRVSTIGLDGIDFGGAHYGKAGIGASGFTPDGMALYASSSKCAGTPITKISVETKRLLLGSGAEPVCLFSGGNAVDFKHEWRDNYSADGFSKSVKHDDPADGIYLYFWPKEQYKAANENDEPPYVAGFSYFIAPKSNEKGAGAAEMQEFARENGFELIEKDGNPVQILPENASKSAGVMKWYDCDDWNETAASEHWISDMEVKNYNGTRMVSNANNVTFYSETTGGLLSVSRVSEMYFGVSYTYNPYRAITGVSGLVTPYTETSNSLKYSGLKTPAGTMQLTNVSIQGNPVTGAGITLGYYSSMNMEDPLYNQWDIQQKSDLPWMTQEATEIQTHNLLSCGPNENRLPIRRDEIMFVTQQNAGEFKEYLPVCDMRTPGDYAHPMNLALDTANLDSSYLYLYLRKDAGGRTDEDDTCHNLYTKKKYVAAVVCGTGKTPEAAIANLYAKMTEQWASVAGAAGDIPANPLCAEFDEIIPVELSDENPWYSLHLNDVEHCNHKSHLKVPYRFGTINMLPGNEAALRRWGPAEKNGKSADEAEGTHDCAYIGVIRTNNPAAAVYGVMKYYTKDENASSTLNVGGTECKLAGGPVKSKEGSYFIYYTANKGAASAPITDIILNEKPFINGMNTAYSCSGSDRVNGRLPGYSELRMRADEQCYIHTAFDMEDLPYIERLYIGTGKSEAEAYADLISSSGANAATNVNCNYNAYTDQWIAIGYRRTADAANAIRDVFLYIGNDPPRQFRKTDTYTVTMTKKKGKTTTAYTPYTYMDYRLNDDGTYAMDENGELILEEYTGVPYTLVRHNLKSGAENFSLNTGTGGPGLYLYYATAERDFVYGKDPKNVLPPIKNIAFAYGDISPKYASTEQLAEVYQDTLHGQKTFDISAYAQMSWENVLALQADSPEAYSMDGTGCFAASLNYGTLPKYGNSVQHTGDRQVRMYADRGAGYTPRTAAALTDEGYYSSTTRYGTLAVK